MQPIALRYPQGDSINCIAPYIDNDVFVSHVWRVLGEKEVLIELWFCPPILAYHQERRVLADYAQKQILAILQQNTKVLPQATNTQFSI